MGGKRSRALSSNGRRRFLAATSPLRGLVRGDDGSMMGREAPHPPSRTGGRSLGTVSAATCPRRRTSGRLVARVVMNQANSIQDEDVMLRHPPAR